MAGGSAGEYGVVRGVCVTGGADRVRIAMGDGEERVVAAGQSCRQPRGGCVASIASGWPPRRGVIGIRSPCVIRHVAAGAKSGRARKDIADVA